MTMAISQANNGQPSPCLARSLHAGADVILDLLRLGVDRRHLRRDLPQRTVRVWVSLEALQLPLALSNPLRCRP